MPCGDARQRLDLKNGDIVDLGNIGDGEMVVRDGDELVGQAVPGGSTPTGTGFVHITAGVQDGAAKLVESADVDAALKDPAAATAGLRTLGTGAAQAAAGDDTRLSNARTPTAHKTSHEPGGSDAMTVDAAASTGSLRTLGTGAAQACAGNDARLFDSRAPNGAAGGALSGTYPNPTLASGYTAAQIKLKSSDQTGIGTTFADVTDLGFALASGKTYGFHYYLVMQADATTTGIDVSVNGPATVFLYYSKREWGGVSNPIDRGATTYDSSVPATSSIGTSPRIYEVYGTLKTSASGTLIPRAKREAVGSGPDCLAGSYGLLWALD